MTNHRLKLLIVSYQHIVIRKSSHDERFFVASHKIVFLAPLLSIVVLLIKCTMQIVCSNMALFIFRRYRLLFDANNWFQKLIVFCCPRFIYISNLNNRYFENIFVGKVHLMWKVKGRGRWGRYQDVNKGRGWNFQVECRGLWKNGVTRWGKGQIFQHLSFNLSFLYK